jgi:hypothetical protein
MKAHVQNDDDVKAKAPILTYSRVALLNSHSKKGTAVLALQMLLSENSRLVPYFSSPMQKAFFILVHQLGNRTIDGPGIDRT